MDISWSTIYLSLDWAIRIGALIYVPQQRSPNAARAWLLLIFFMPILGIILYAWVGRIYLPRQRLDLIQEANQHILEVGQQLAASTPDVYKAYGSENTQLQQQIDMIEALTEFPAVDNSHIEVLFGYDDLLERLLEDIQAAKKSIHLLYYIYAHDETSQRFTDALCAAAKRGVKVRMLLDAVGAHKGLKHQAPQLRAAGVEVHAALPVELFRINVARMDLRNHRKIAVIDGMVAHMGSQNIVSPVFVPGLPNEELNLRLRGLAVYELQAVFLADWYIETSMRFPEEETTELFKMEGLPANLPKHATQVVPSGPGYGGATIRDVMISLMYAAEKEFCIVTPYFVPDEPFLAALITAARREVKVQLIFPKISNHKIPNWVQESYYTQLLQAGIEIYRYKPAMLHAKFMVFDNQIGLVGSPNIDVRSFMLNAEVALAIYDARVVQKLRDIQKDCIGNSEPVDLDIWQKRPKLKKITANLARLADALL